MKIGEVLKQERIDAGLTQVQVCKKAKLSQTFLSQVEGNKKYLSPQMLKKLCKVYGTLPAFVVWKAIEETDVKPKHKDAFNKVNKSVIDLINEFSKK